MHKRLCASTPRSSMACSRTSALCKRQTTDRAGEQQLCLLLRQAQQLARRTLLASEERQIGMLANALGRKPLPRNRGHGARVTRQRLGRPPTNRPSRRWRSAPSGRAPSRCCRCRASCTPQAWCPCRRTGPTPCGCRPGRSVARTRAPGAAETRGRSDTSRERRGRPAAVCSASRCRPLSRQGLRTRQCAVPRSSEHPERKLVSWAIPRPTFECSLRWGLCSTSLTRRAPCGRSTSWWMPGSSTSTVTTSSAPGDDLPRALVSLDLRQRFEQPAGEANRIAWPPVRARSHDVLRLFDHAGNEPAQRICLDERHVRQADQQAVVLAQGLHAGGQRARLAQMGVGGFDDPAVRGAHDRGHLGLMRADHRRDIRQERSDRRQAFAPAWARRRWDVGACRCRTASRRRRPTAERLFASV